MVQSYLSRGLQYVTDNLCIVCKSIELVLFADDTNLFSSGSNAIILQDGVNNELAIIAEWLKVNSLSLNIKKTHSMFFSAKNKSHPGISLQFDGEAIADVNESKFLGVIIDNKLNRNDHISFVFRKIARGIRL